MRLSFRFTALLLTASLALAGCNSGSNTSDEHGHNHGDEHGHDHDHDHDHGMDPSAVGLDVDQLPSSGSAPLPDNYPEATTSLIALVQTIGEGLDDGDVDSVHGELHEVGYAIENVEKLAKSSEQSDDVVAATGILFDAFSEIDAKLHGLEGKDYSDVKDEISAAVKTLQASLNGE
ncbi:hypothetical protein [Crateriforma spongiae]|uniref:hypothetical protein n=1 Tax=Crateriforma spongiae TaxID=2724528 RepID=UPI0014474A05|nr:hypothetical protein [Crateriforma spongiae]